VRGDSASAYHRNAVAQSSCWQCRSFIHALIPALSDCLSFSVPPLGFGPVKTDPSASLSERRTATRPDTAEQTRLSSGSLPPSYSALISEAVDTDRVLTQQLLRSGHPALLDKVAFHRSDVLGVRARAGALTHRPVRAKHNPVRWEPIHHVVL
jgi:hypothetical protein